MLDLGRIDVEEIATALADQTDHEHRWLIDPRTGEVVFWMQIVSARMCWRQATVRPLKSEPAIAAPNVVVIGVVHAIHSSSAASITQVHQFTGTAASATAKTFEVHNSATLAPGASPLCALAFAPVQASTALSCGRAVGQIVTSVMSAHALSPTVSRIQSSTAC